MDPTHQTIGRALDSFQRDLIAGGTSLNDHIETTYVRRWESDAMIQVLRVRTAFVMGIQEYLVSRGLLNIERVQLSLLTDPLNHDIEHTPSIPYKGLPYVTTHSMIYSKFLACHAPGCAGIFVDSPNIRLEVASPSGEQRGRYLVDFSQMDVEVRRNRGLTFEDYLERPQEVEAILRADYEDALRFFEMMLCAGLERVVSVAEDALHKLGVAIEVPTRPFPIFWLDDALSRYPKTDVEAGLGAETTAPFFWIGGLMRENYDLIYPFLLPEGGRRTLSQVRSREIYNYDLCAKSILRASGRQTEAREILSGGLREWIYEAIVGRLLDNRILSEAPVWEDGNLANIARLGGYGPFLSVAARRREDGSRPFPETFGGGLGIERSLWSLLRGPEVRHIDEVTCFGKNPDSHPIYLF